MKSGIFREVSTCLFLILCISVAVQTRYFYSTTEETPIMGIRVDCFSPKLTIRHLQAVAHNVRCSGNNNREFWALACNCVVNNLPDAQCPNCRTLRNAEGRTANANGSDVRTTPSSFTSTKIIISTEDSDITNKKQRLFHNSTSVSNSANFIRFGK